MKMIKTRLLLIILSSLVFGLVNAQNKDSIPYYTTLAASAAVAIAIQKWHEGEIGVKSLQDY